jgi:hypothetical protein
MKLDNKWLMVIVTVVILAGAVAIVAMAPQNQGSVAGSVNHLGARVKGPLVGRIYGRRRGSIVGGGFAVLKPAASALGMTPQALITALKSGQTISSLAAAKGLTVASLESTISTSIQSQLQALVTNGKLTQSRETQMYNKLEQSITSGNWITQLQNAGKGGHRQQSVGQPTTQL